MARRHGRVELRPAGVRAPASGAASCASRLTSVSNSCDWRMGLARYAANKPVVVAGLAPPERAEQDERQRRVAARGCACASCEAVHLRHVHVEDRHVERRARVEQPQRLGGDSVRCATVMPHLRRLQRQHAPVGGVVVDDQHAPAGQLRLHAAKSRCRAGGSVAMGASIVNRNVEPLPGPSLSRPHATAHQLGEPPADREAQAGAAVLARRRRVGLRERLEQPAHRRRRRARCPCRARRTCSSVRPSRTRRGASPSAPTSPRLGELHRVATAG